jgi:hypothetical protein
MNEERTGEMVRLLARRAHPEAGGLLLVGGLLAFVASLLPYERVIVFDTLFGPPDPPVVVTLSGDVGDLVDNALLSSGLQQLGVAAVALVAALVAWGTPLVLATVGGAALVRRQPALSRRRTRVLIRVLVGAVCAWWLLDTAVYLAFRALGAQDTMQVGYWMLCLGYLCALVGAIRLPGSRQSPSPSPRHGWPRTP